MKLNDKEEIKSAFSIIKGRHHLSFHDLDYGILLGVVMGFACGVSVLIDRIPLSQ
jgi:hypothetical protein